MLVIVQKGVRCAYKLDWIPLRIITHCTDFKVETVKTVEIVEITIRFFFMIKSVQNLLCDLSIEQFVYSITFQIIAYIKRKRIHFVKTVKNKFKNNNSVI